MKTVGIVNGIASAQTCHHQVEFEAKSAGRFGGYGDSASACMLPLCVGHCLK